MAHVSRPPFFRRGIEYLAVRPIKLTSTTWLQPGDSVSGLREFQLRRLFSNRRIGPVGHPWTSAMLSDQSTFARPEVTTAIPKAEPVVVPVVPVASPEFLPAPWQNDEGHWMVGTPGEESPFATLEDALEVWNSLNATSTDTAPGQEQPAADVTDVVDTQASSEPSGNEASGATTESADGDNQAKAEKPEPHKEGSQWVVPGVDGKFTSKKKASEAWDAANVEGVSVEEEDFLK